MSMLLDGTQGIDFNDGSNQSTAATPYARKNLIINGDMRIDQRNAGASVSVANTGLYTVDRWRASNGTSTATVQQSSTAPTGFSNSLLWTVSTTDNTANQSHCLQHRIEGYNTAHLNLGTANAETVTLSFWVRSSLTGTYGIGINNSAENRSYVATYTISSADTWEQKTITFTNDTSGTWVGSTNGIGILINFDLGSGSDFNGTADTWQSGNYRRTSGCVNLANTSGATFYITGCQLEINDSASDFEFVPYDMELAKCQRYYYQVNSYGFINMTTNVYNGTIVKFPVSMRATPTCTLYSTTTGTSGKIYYQDGATDVNAAASPASGKEATFARVSNVSTNTGSNMFFKITASSEL